MPVVISSYECMYLEIDIFMAIRHRDARIPVHM